MKTINKELRLKIISEIEANESIFWDNRDGLDSRSIDDIMEKGIHAWLNELHEYNIDYISDTESEKRTEILTRYIEESGLSLNELENEFENYYPFVYIDPKDVFNNEYMNIRVVLYSNYDCINSNWFEGNKYSYKESYFGAMVDALNLNPSVLKKEMLNMGIGTYGAFPNIKSRTGKELVTYKSFCEELINSSCGAMLLTISGKVSLMDLYEISTYEHENCFSEISKVIIPKNAMCGLFSSMQGGGSTLEMELTKDVTIDLKKEGKTKYDRWSIEADKEYSINEVYGMYSSVFKELTIIKK